MKNHHKWFCTDKTKKETKEIESHAKFQSSMFSRYGDTWRHNVQFASPPSPLLLSSVKYLGSNGVKIYYLEKIGYFWGFLKIYLGRQGIFLILTGDFSFFRVGNQTTGSHVIIRSGAILQM